MRILHLLLALLLGAAAAQEALPVAEIDALVEARMSDAGIPGLSLVVVGADGVLYARGYGLANVEEAVPMTACTPVGPGSTMKGLTALAVLQLVEEGRLDLDAPVADPLPWFAVGGEPGEPVTLRHALTMTSGLQDWMDVAMGPDDVLGNDEVGVPHAADALERRVRGMASLVPIAAPGTTWAYSSTGYTIAGLLIETVTGMPYETYMQERVFAPLGMTSTGFGAAEAAQGYLRIDGELRPEPPLQAAGYRPAGLDVVTSACDFGAYLSALLDGGAPVVSPASVEAMWTPAAPVGDRAAYGIGWYVHDWNGTKVVQHGGHAMTSGSAVFLAPEARLAVAVFANVDDLHVDAIGQALFERLTGASPIVRRPPSGFEPDRSVWEAYVGTYDTVQGVPLRIFVEEGSLKATVDAVGIEFTLEAFGDADFVTRSLIPDVDGADATFEVAADGAVHLLVAGEPFGVKAP